MARILVVNHDVDVADLEVDALRRSGHEVEQCGGPTHAVVGCPVMQGMACWQVDWAEVLVYDAWAAGDGAADLTADVRMLYPDKAIVLTSSGMALDWATDTGPNRVTTLVGAPTTAGLAKAVEDAIASMQA